MKLDIGPGIWVFVSTPLLVTERQLLPEPQRRSIAFGGSAVSGVKIGSGVENMPAGALRRLKMWGE